MKRQHKKQSTSLLNYIKITDTKNIMEILTQKNFFIVARTKNTAIFLTVSEPS